MTNPQNHRGSTLTDYSNKNPYSSRITANYVLNGESSKKETRHIVFDLGDDMGASTCVGCGECVQACPTGALMPKASLDENGVYANTPDRKVDSLCPYCGVGCQLTFNIQDD